MNSVTLCLAPIALAAIALGVMFAPASAARVPLVQRNARPAVHDDVLYSFKGGSDGFMPEAGVELGSDGALYGTTYHSGSGCFDGCGTIFRLARGASGWTKTTLHAFNGTDGAYPNANLVAGPRGAWFGVTQEGGPNGSGEVFELTPSGSNYTLTVLYGFPGAGQPSGVVMDSSGALYGTTIFGGAYGNGTVFALLPSGSGYVEKTLFDFPKRKHHGDEPFGEVALANGTIYGTAGGGGLYKAGVLFSLTPAGSGYDEAVLHEFGGSAGGPTFGGILAADGSGDFYGITSGAISELIRGSSGYENVVLHGFGGGSDGTWPDGMLREPDGTMYGTTLFGGNDDWCLGNTGCGTVFELVPGSSGYAETVLYRFVADDADANAPMPGLIMDKHGTIYGTSQNGGTGVFSECGNPSQGCGTVWSLRTKS
jgi:uncharacterized repeat protein (TIGR03803 family)